MEGKLHRREQRKRKAEVGEKQKEAHLRRMERKKFTEYFEKEFGCLPMIERKKKIFDFLLEKGLIVLRPRRVCEYEITEKTLKYGIHYLKIQTIEVVLLENEGSFNLSNKVESSLSKLGVVVNSDSIDTIEFRSNPYVISTIKKYGIYNAAGLFCELKLVDISLKYLKFYELVVKCLDRCTVEFLKFDSEKALSSTSSRIDRMEIEAISMEFQKSY